MFYVCGFVFIHFNIKNNRGIKTVYEANGQATYFTYGTQLFRINGRMQRREEGEKNNNSNKTTKCSRCWADKRYLNEASEHKNNNNKSFFDFGFSVWRKAVTATKATSRLLPYTVVVLIYLSLTSIKFLCIFHLCRFPQEGPFQVCTYCDTLNVGTEKIVYTVHGCA